MNDMIPLPTPDPMPLPGPVWLLLTLLLVTFLLHLFAMNLTVGGTLLAAISSLRRKQDAFAGRLAADLVKVLPISLAFTITLGVAALLFVQVLYGNLLYASSILIGAFWIAVIPTLIVAYYGLYYSKAHPESTGALWMSLLLLLAIGFVYVNNFTLMLSPHRWIEMYRQSSAGLNLNLADPSLAPRYLHFMLGAFAIAGFFVFAAGAWNRTTEYGQWMMRKGAHWFVAPTLLNYAVGMWFLMALPRNVLLGLFTANRLGAVVVALGMLFPIAAVAHVVLATRTDKTVLHTRLAVAMTVLTMATMVGLRQLVRVAYLTNYVHLSELPVRPQWSVIVLFVLLFLGGLVAVYAMIQILGKSRLEEHTTLQGSST